MSVRGLIKESVKDAQFEHVKEFGSKSTGLDIRLANRVAEAVLAALREGGYVIGKELAENEEINLIDPRGTGNRLAIVRVEES